MNDERMDDGRIYRTKRKIGETQLDKRETQGINARDFRIATGLYESYRDESDYVYIWTEHLPFILDNIPLVFGIDENDHEEIWLFQLLILNIVRNANERCQEYFQEYIDLACYPKDMPRIPRLIQPQLCIALVNDYDFQMRHGSSHNLFRFKAENLPLLLRALRLPKQCVLPGQKKGWVIDEELMLIALYVWAHLDTQDTIARKFGVRGGDVKISQIYKYFNWHCFERLLPHFFHNNIAWFKDRMSMYRDRMTERIVDAGYINPPNSPNRTVASIDTIAIYCCEPGRGPRERGPNAERGPWMHGFWSENDSANVLKLQAVVAPDGLVMDVFGPVGGTFGDARMCNTSGINEHLEYLNYLWELPEHERLQIIGDSAYPMRPCIVKCNTVRPRAWSEALKKSRVKVELCFGGVQLFGNRITQQSKNKLLNKANYATPRGSVPQVFFATSFFFI